MSVEVMLEAYLSINGVELHDHCTSITVTRSHESQDATTFTTGGGKASMHGLKEDSIEIELLQDFAVGEVESTLGPLLENKSTFPVIVRPKQAPKSATNPEYTADCKLFELPSLDGSPGDLVKIKIKFEPQNTGVTKSVS